MLSPPTHGDAFYDALATMAEKLRRTITALVDGERFQYVQRRVADSEIVFGVWPDAQGTGGFGFHLIKGRRHLAAVMAELPDELTTAAIPCVGAEQAIAAEQLWGDQRPNTNPSDVVVPLGKRKKAKPRPKRTPTAKVSSPRMKTERRSKVIHHA
jgi:hypothetical protein